ncbi:MAG: thiolase family protein [Acidilobus sp.]
MPRLLKNVYIVDGVRVPIGKFGGAYKDVPAVDLASFTLKELLSRVNLKPNEIDMVIYGHVIRAGTGMDTARQAALKAGVPENIDSMTVDMVCASGMAAVITAANYIAAGSYNLIVAGGMESMSMAPFLISSMARWGVKHLIGREWKLLDSMVYDGLWDVMLNKVMGEEADLTAKEYKAPRDELDRISFESHMRAAKAWDSGAMKDFVVPYEKNGKVVLDHDEGIRRDTSIEKLKALPYAFTPEGPHTAGSSSQLSDGAASLLIASEEAVKSMGLKPLARIVGFAYHGVETWRFPAAPVGAIKRLLEDVGWTKEMVDYWENNEAFAVNSYILHKELGVPYDRMNVHGGAIAVGHPLGMSGARITLELINVLRRHGGKRGVASICHGLGGAAAIAIELV